MMEKRKDEMHDNGKRYSLKVEKVEDLFTILEDHVDEVITLVEEELLPYIYKYTELCGNPRPDSRLREEDICFIFDK